MTKNSRTLVNSFNEFPTVSQDEWRNVVSEVLPNFHEDSNQDNITNVVYPLINTKEQLPPVDDEVRSIKKVYTVVESALRNSPDEKTLRSLINLGVQGIYGPDRCIAETIPLLQTLEHPFSRLSIEMTSVNGSELSSYFQYLRDAYQKKEPVQGTVYSPASQWSHWQSNPPDLRYIAQLIDNVANLPTVRVLTVAGDTFYNRGASVIDELAMSLSWWVYYCDQLTDLGVPIEKVIKHTEFTLATGTDFFSDLAKFRSARSLVQKVSKAYSVSRSEPPQLRAVSGIRNKTFYDPDSNILRNTTEALAAMIGGVDTLSLLSHDFLYPSSGDFGTRTAIQLSNIMHHEAHIGEVTDPASGSYLLENITAQLFEKSWQLFLKFEDQGGFQTLVSKGIIDNRCQQHLNDQLNQTARQTRVSVGATRYTNALEEAAAIDFEETALRLPGHFEQLRNAMDKQAAQGKARPLVHLLIQVDERSTALINQRANYVRDLLVSVGFDHKASAIIDDNDDVSTAMFGVHSTGTILCGTNDFYKSIITSLSESDQKPSTQWYIAGGNQALESAVQQAGGGGVVGIGHDVISVLKQMIKSTKYEA